MLGLTGINPSDGVALTGSGHPAGWLSYCIAPVETCRALGWALLMSSPARLVGLGDVLCVCYNRGWLQSGGPEAHLVVIASIQSRSSGIGRGNLWLQSEGLGP